MRFYITAIYMVLVGAIILSVVIAVSLFIDVPQYNTPQSLFFLNLPLIIGTFVFYFFGGCLLVAIVFLSHREGDEWKFKGERVT